MSDEHKESFDSLPDREKAFVELVLRNEVKDFVLLVNIKDEFKKGQIGILAVNRSDLQTFGVSQVIDSNNLLIGSNSIWIEGVPTENLVDEGAVSLKGFGFYVSGSKTYTTAIGGSRTVKHLIAINRDEANKVIASVVESKGFRLWNDLAGSSIIAKYRNRNGTKGSSKVSLELPNGKTVSLRFDTLSETDQEWIAEQ